jgi:opacity protein-like surface antigen
MEFRIFLTDQFVQSKPEDFLAGLLRCVVLVSAFICICQGSTTAQDIEQMVKSEPVELSGALSATTIFYNSSGIQSRYLPFNYVISGTPVLSLYGIHIPFSFIIGRQHSSVTQPFNQFGLSPRYKAVTAHLGYRNLTWSPLTLAGHTFLGAGVEVQSGLLRFGAMYGQLNKATALDTTRSLYFSNFSYKRTGMAVRVGIGNEEHFFDVIALKAKDIASSARRYSDLADSIGMSPAENTVIGYNMRISLWKQRLTVESDAAISLFTNDMRAPEIDEERFDSNVRRLKALGDLNISSELYGAVQTGLRYRYRNMAVRLTYRYVDPGYQSMGAYWLNNDLENVTVAPAFTLLNNKLRFNGSLGLQRDDLSNNKRAKAKKVIGSANLSADLSKRLNADLSFSNYSINQTVKTIRFADSLKVVQSSRQFSVMPRYTISGGNETHMFMFAVNLSAAKELNPFREDSVNTDINTSNLTMTYQLGLTQEKASLFLSLNHTAMQSALIEDRNRGLTIGGSKSALENRLSVSISMGYLFAERNNEQGTIINGSLQGRYAVHRRHALRLSAYHTGNTPDKPSAAYPKFTETRAEFGYGFTL